MDNLQAAYLMYELADLLELQGADTFKVRAYRRAGQALELLLEDLTALHARGRLEEIDGVGRAIAGKLAEWLTTGSLRFLEELRAAVPPGLRELMRIPGLGARTVALLHQRLGIRSLTELAEAAQQGRLRDLPGFGVKKEAQILDALQKQQQRQALAPAWQLHAAAAAVMRWLESGPPLQRLALAGDLRRQAAAAAGVELVAAAADPDPVLVHLAACPALAALAETTMAPWPPGGRQGWATARLTSGRPLRLHVVPPAGFAAALHMATGSARHRAALQERAQAQGLAWTETGPGAGTYPDEAALYAALGLTLVPPELREGEGEVPAAAEGWLPRLVAPDDIRGDLHAHTTASDGTATAAELAAAAARLGYEYLAITDHSPSLKVARGLDRERLAAQAAELAAYNAGAPAVRLLKGTEVDILKDGRLDWDDTVLAELDVVVASIHSAMQLDAEAQTARLEAAIKNPHVDIIGHPTGRKLGVRDPYPLALERLLELAARTGTAVEISSSPARLDLSGEQSRLAKALGVKVAINTDAHAPSELEHLPWGLGQARRGWIEAADVVNAMPLADLLTWLRKEKG